MSQPSSEDWEKANNLKHLDKLEAPALRAAYRELSAINYMYSRVLKGIQQAASLETQEER